MANQIAGTKPNHNKHTIANTYMKRALLKTDFGCLNPPTRPLPKAITMPTPRNKLEIMGQYHSLPKPNKPIIKGCKAPIIRAAVKKKSPIAGCFHLHTGHFSHKDITKATQTKNNA